MISQAVYTLLEWLANDSALQPLAGVRVVELHARGPAPFCTLLLASFGAQIHRIIRPGDDPSGSTSADNAKRAVLDLKSSEDRAQTRAIIETTDVLGEGLRPGAMERLDLSPADCMHATRA